MVVPRGDGSKHLGASRTPCDIRLSHYGVESTRRGLRYEQHVHTVSELPRLRNSIDQCDLGGVVPYFLSASHSG